MFPFFVAENCPLESFRCQPPAACCQLSSSKDAIEILGDDSPMPPADSAVSFLKQVAAAEVREFPAVSLGETLRLQTVGIVGVGLRAEEALVHLAAFRSNGDRYRNPSGPGMGMRRASQRFRGWS